MSTRLAAAWMLAAALSLSACGGGGEAAPDRPVESIPAATPAPAPAAAETAAVAEPPAAATPAQAQGYEQCLATARRGAGSPDEAAVLARRCASLPGAPR